MKKIGMYEIMAKKNNMILAHDNYYGDYFLGTLEQLKSLSCPVNQIGTLKEIKKELTRWKTGWIEIMVICWKLKIAFLEF